MLVIKPEAKNIQKMLSIVTKHVVLQALCKYRPVDIPRQLRNGTTPHGAPLKDGIKMKMMPRRRRIVLLYIDFIIINVMLS